MRIKHIRLMVPVRRVGRMALAAFFGSMIGVGNGAGVRTSPAAYELSPLAVWLTHNLGPTSCGIASRVMVWERGKFRRARITVRVRRSVRCLPFAK